MLDFFTMKHYFSFTEFRTDQIFSLEIRILLFRSRKSGRKEPPPTPNILLVYNSSPGIMSLAFQILYKKNLHINYWQTTGIIAQCPYRYYREAHSEGLIGYFNLEWSWIWFFLSVLICCESWWEQYLCIVFTQIVLCSQW